MLERDDLEALEREVRAALESGNLSGLDVLGFGEVTTVLRLSRGDDEYAVKRLPPYRNEARARAAATLIEEYIRGLEERGIDVIDTELHVLPWRDGEHVVYAVQPALASDVLGPEVFRRFSDAEVDRAFERLLRTIRRAVSPTLTPDGQLSNWALIGSELRYLDVTSPFMRDEEGNERFDFDAVVNVLPVGLRFVVRRWGVHSTLDTYFSLRGQAIDVLGNLEKEGLGHHIPRLVPIANEVLALERPIRLETVTRYYANDARLYAVLQFAARARCWVLHHVLGRPYPFLPKPAVERFAAK